MANLVSILGFLKKSLGATWEVQNLLFCGAYSEFYNRWLCLRRWVLENTNCNNSKFGFEYWSLIFFFFQLLARTWFWIGLLLISWQEEFFFSSSLRHVFGFKKMSGRKKMQHFTKNIVTSTIPGSQFARNFPPSPSDSLICIDANSLCVCVRVF